MLMKTPFTEENSLKLTEMFLWKSNRSKEEGTPTTHICHHLYTKTSLELQKQNKNFSKRIFFSLPEIRCDERNLYVGHKSGMTGAFDFTTKSFRSSDDPRLSQNDARGRGGHFSTPTSIAGEKQLALPTPVYWVFFLLWWLFCCCCLYLF